jgi:hypothetical protein
MQAREWFQVSKDDFVVILLSSEFIRTWQILVLYALPLYNSKPITAPLVSIEGLQGVIAILQAKVTPVYRFNREIISKGLPCATQARSPDLSLGKSIDFSTQRIIAPCPLLISTLLFSHPRFQPQTPCRRFPPLIPALTPSSQSCE